jgi:hypothetical protein
VVLVAVPALLSVGLAQQKFVADSTRTSPGSRETSIQDYMDFGKKPKFMRRVVVILERLLQRHNARRRIKGRRR